jgi:hypothetical protein
MILDQYHYSNLHTSIIVLLTVITNFLKTFHYIMYPIYFIAYVPFFFKIVSVFKDRVVEFHRFTCCKRKIRSERIPAVPRMLTHTRLSIVLNVWTVRFAYSVKRLPQKASSLILHFPGSTFCSRHDHCECMNFTVFVFLCYIRARFQ